jgi:hypothetical protein
MRFFVGGPEPFRSLADAVREALKQAEGEWSYELSNGPVGYSFAVDVCDKAENASARVLLASDAEGAGSAELAFAVFRALRTSGQWP